MTTSPAVPQVALFRALIGLAQGAVLYLLFKASQDKAWPATNGELFAPMLVVTIFVPLIVVAAIDNLRVVPLVIWTIVAAMLCAGLAYYDIYSEPTTLRFGSNVFGTGGADARVVPGFTLWLALAAGLFILQSLIVSAAADGRIVASYARHFDVSWKLAVQIVLATGFVGIFWALLWLGASLFGLIQLGFLENLIKQSWFSIPVTTLSVACALHITDASTALVRGTRTLKLTLLSWLLPMMMTMAVAFLLALPFTGLEPLWNTRRATSILLITAGALVVLINAAYQDGLPEPTVTPVMRYSRMVASIALVPIVALAAYGLYLRVNQYGWTPQRVTSGACVFILTCYAIGYGVAVLTSGSALRGLRTTNVATAYAILAVMLALFTPIADPARISVADQIARLNSGQTSADKFDYKFLRFDAGILGRVALADLGRRTDGSQAAEISKRAAEAQALNYRYQAAAIPPATPETREANITLVFPAGQKLPENFLRRDWKTRESQFFMPPCLTGNSKCEAILADLDNDGAMEVLLLSVPTGVTMAFKTLPDGSWTPIGSIVNIHCPGVRDALRAGKFAAVEPAYRDIEAAGERLRIAGGTCGVPPATAPAVKAVPPALVPQ